jgi:hypothetical protein
MLWLQGSVSLTHGCKKTLIEASDRRIRAKGKAEPFFARQVFAFHNILVL